MQNSSHNFVQNWFVNKDFLVMTLFKGGIIQVKGTFQNMIAATLNVRQNLTLKTMEIKHGLSNAISCLSKLSPTLWIGMSVCGEYL